MEFQSTLPVNNLPTEPLSIELNRRFTSSYPLVKSSSAEGTIGSKIVPPTYSEDQHQTWQRLVDKHQPLVESENYLCQEYKDGLKKLCFSRKTIPDLKTTSEKLKNLTGWQIIRVDGYVIPMIFFKLLANKLFPCTDFIRSEEESDFTAEPDTFHDQIGHLPMIANQRFADFFHFFGLAGTKITNSEQLECFNRIYWYTIETGLINPTRKEQTSDQTVAKIYGASIASSCGEILYSLSDNVKRHKFDLDTIIKTPFDISTKQQQLFEISSFDELEDSFRMWAIKNKFIS